MILISLNSFSQKDSIVVKTDTNIVRITKPIAIFIAKELVEKDALKKENILLKEDTSTLRLEIGQYKKDSTLNVKKESIFKSIQEDNNKIISNYQESTKTLSKQLTWSKTKTTVAEVLLLATIIEIIIKK